MKLFKTVTDNVTTKVFAEDAARAIDILMEFDANYFKLNGKLVYEFDDSCVYDVYIKEIEIKEGVVL